MAKRIPKESIVYGSERVLTADQLDLIRWYHPREVIIVGQDEESEYLTTGSGVPRGISNISGSLFPKAGPSGPSGPKIVTTETDVPDLSDIEYVEKEEYYDPVSKALKVRVKIRIRNSSKNKTEIAGVDARIKP